MYGTEKSQLLGGMEQSAESPNYNLLHDFKI